jgi:23S rRNA pseudoU1915 N3-methylase RlmH
LCGKWNNKNNNNNKKKKKKKKQSKSKMSHKLRLGAIIIIIIRNGAKTISSQFGELNNNTNVIRNRAKVKCLINYS